MPEHRARPRRLRAFAPAAFGSLAAVAIVVGVIVGINLLRHHHTAAPGPVASDSVSSPSPTASSPSASPTTSRASATPTVHPTTAKPTPSTTPTPAPGAIPVDVFNNSRVRGRAALATSRLRAAGYVVPLSVSRGYAGANVVYYDAGNAAMAAAARGVVARHLGITAAVVRPSSIPSTGGLIVVVTSTYR